MDKLGQLYEERGKIVEDLNRIKKDVEAGQWNDTIDSEFDSLSKDFDKLTANIEIEKRLEGIEDEQSRYIEHKKRQEEKPEGRALIDSNGKEHRIYRKDENINSSPWIVTPGQFFRAYIDKPNNEFEERALGTGTSSAGGYLAPARLMDIVVDKLRQATTVFKAGAQTMMLQPLNGGVTWAIAKTTGDITASWKDEHAESTAADPTFGTVTLSPQTLRSYVIASRELLQDSLLIEEALEKSFIGAFAEALDAACIEGSGVEPIPEGLYNYDNINQVFISGVNGGKISADLYNSFAEALHELYDAGVQNVTGAIMSNRTYSDFLKLKATDNQPLMKPDVIVDWPFLHTSAISDARTVGTSANQCSTIYLGDFSQMIVGIRKELTIQPLVERRAEYHEVGFLASFRADVQALHQEAFCKIEGVIRESGTIT